MTAELFGREAELDLLRDRLADAVKGRPATVLIQGEPGIGKSALARALTEAAAAAGAQVGWGTALEDPDAPPFWVWDQALRRAGARIPDVFAQGGAEDRFRQFDTVARMVGTWSAKDPLVLVLDDAHWMDEPSLLLLIQLIRGLTDERLLVIVTARDTEARHPGLLRRVAGSSGVTTLRLRGLLAPDIRRQLAAQLQRYPDDDLVAQVESLTAGNPFFIRETAFAIRDGRSGWRQTASPTVEAAIGARVERLGGDAVRFLRSGAVLGLEFFLETAATTAAIPPAVALAAADELQAARLLEPGAVPGELRFAHALVQEAIAARLSTQERVSLHRRAAEAIERAARGGTPPVFELARHWREVAAAGEVGPALRWLELAAREALRQLAYEDAARLLRDALRIGGAGLDDERRCRLLLELGRASHLATDLPGRLEACLDAAAVARRLGRSDLLAEAALLMEPGGGAGPDLAARRLATEALGALDPRPSPLRARLLARYAETFIYQSVEKEADAASEQALAMAVGCEDQVALAAALRTRQVIRSGPDGLDEREDLARRQRSLGGDTGRPDLALRGLLAAADVALERGDLAGLAALMSPLARCAEEVGGPLARFQALSCEGVLAQAQGRVDDARRLVAEAFAILQPTGYAAAWHVRDGLLAAVAHHAGSGTEALAALAMADAPGGIGQAPALIARISHAHALDVAGRLEEAAGLYASLGPVESWQVPPHVLLVTATLGLAVAIRLRHPDVSALAAKLEPYKGHHAVSGLGAVAYYGPVELWLGLARACLDDLHGAVVLLETAERASAQAGAAGFQVECQAELAATLLRRGGAGDAARARGLIATAVRQARRLRLTRMVNRLAEIATQLDDPAARLTLREREVAALVARGLTNREIARRLFLSERTAQNHVQHILDKLELENRSQVAAWMARRESEQPI